MRPDWVSDELYPFVSRFSFLMRSWVGHFMIKRMNCFVNKVVPKANGNKAVIAPEMMHHYRRALPNPQSRNACAALPGHIISATDRLDQIWSDREKFPAKPSLVFWGVKDIAFRRKELEHGRQNLTDCQVHEFKDCRHFLAEEAPDRVLPMLRSFLARA